MKVRTFLKKFSLFIFICSIVYPSQKVFAFAEYEGEELIVDQAKLYPTAIARIYRARVLLENHENWGEAHELLRSVIRYGDHLPDVAVRKLQQSFDTISWYLPKSVFRDLTNRRHLVRPFLETQYLLNEALMDLRIALNTSNDSEILYIEDLLCLSMVHFCLENLSFYPQPKFFNS